jgi:cytoskeletal protein RodZ
MIRTAVVTLAATLLANVAFAQAPKPTPAPTMTAPATAMPKPAATTPAATTPPAGTPSSTTTSTATKPPASSTRFTDEAAAKEHCPTDTVVWMNTSSKVYHLAGTSLYGKTKKGAYSCQKDADQSGFHVAKGEVAAKH